MKIKLTLESQITVIDIYAGFFKHLMIPVGEYEQQE